MRDLISNITYLIVSFFATTFAIIREKPLYNEDFMSKFSNPEDKKRLSEAVREMKENSKEDFRKIELENGESITIVVR